MLLVVFEVHGCQRRQDISPIQRIKQLIQRQTALHIQQNQIETDMQHVAIAQPADFKVNNGKRST